MSLSACRRLRPGRRRSPSARTVQARRVVSGNPARQALPAKPLKSFGPDARSRCAGVLLPLPEARPESVEVGHDVAGLPGRGAVVCGRIVAAGPGVAAVSGGAGAAGRCGGLVPGLGNILLRSCHGPWR